MKVYFICGLAADSRVFRHIHLPQGYEPVYLDWIRPEKDELLADYALRLAQNIEANERFSLIGLSMGGMIATEIAKKFNPVSTILISSIPTSEHLPKYYRVAATLRLQNLLPISFIQKAAVLKRFFTTETGEDKWMLKDMIRKSDPYFIRWAMNAVLGWENKEVPGHLVQIHGSKDAILPKRNTNPTHVIKSGGHLMVITRAKEINEILNEVLCAPKAEEVEQGVSS